MGWDAFGLPAENYAIKRGIHPRITTEKAIATYKRQMNLIGLSYDWSREISSIDPDYYRWTQWFFLLMYERGLAYRGTGQQWWCPVDKTILANEQVHEGRCWRIAVDVGTVEYDFRHVASKAVGRTSARRVVAWTGEHGCSGIVGAHSVVPGWRCRCARQWR
jgi:leucyl-tRNA synthetase